MDKSFLILGREPSLSFAELYRHLGGHEALIIAHNEGAVIVDDPELGQFAPALLGGFIKSGLVVAILPRLTAAALAGLLVKQMVSGQKFHFGLSFYGFRASPDTTPYPLLPPLRRAGKEEGTKKLGLEVKRLLKVTGASVRLVESRHANLSSADVVKNRLTGEISKGVELCIFPTDDGFMVGKTLAVQPYEEYAERDYGRPEPDPRSGMLPPKLARMMVNLAVGPARGLTILDPFCGSGTVLQEALLLGHQAVGTDIDEEAIRGAKKNMEWLLRQHKADLPPYRVEPLDVRALDKKLTAGSVDAVVTECDLGPPLSGEESQDDIIEIEKDLSPLYAEALALIHYVLRPGGRTVLAWPYFVEPDIWVSAFGQLGELGWELVEPYPQEYQAIFPLSKRGTLLYGRPDQRVWREILLLKKKPTRVD